jgi:hypothetical protein
MFDLTIHVATQPLNVRDDFGTKIPEIPAQQQILNGHYHTNMQNEDQQLGQHGFS